MERERAHNQISARCTWFVPHGGFCGVCPKDFEVSPKEVLETGEVDSNRKAKDPPGDCWEPLCQVCDKFTQVQGFFAPRKVAFQN